jgi:hypothetical protein
MEGNAYRYRNQYDILKQAILSCWPFAHDEDDIGSVANPKCEENVEKEQRLFARWPRDGDATLKWIITPQLSLWLVQMTGF